MNNRRPLAGAFLASTFVAGVFIAASWGRVAVPAGGVAALATGVPSAGVSSIPTGPRTGQRVSVGSADPSTRAGSAPPPRSLVTSVASWHLPHAVSRAVVVPDRGAILVLGGVDRAGASSAAVIGVGPRGGQVRIIGSLASPTHDAGGAVVGGSAFVFGGGRSVATEAVESFTASPGASTVAVLRSSGRGRVVGRLPRARADLATVADQGRVYLVGGWDGTATLATVLDTTDGIHMQAAGLLPQAVRYPAVAALDGSIWVFGGQRNGHAVDAIQRLDLASGRASVAGHLPAPLSEAAAVTLGGTIYLLGGRSAGVPTARIWRFDPLAGTLSEAGSLPYAVADAGLAVIGDTVYLVGGEGSRTLDSTVIVRLGPAR